MESLVDEKVDAFWRGVDSEASKSGQIIVTFSEKKQKKTTWFQVYAGEVHLSSSSSVLQLLNITL
jgi:autophagy-related protein 101